MAGPQTFKASIIARHATTGTAYVFDFGYLENSGSEPHIDTATAAAAFKTLVETKWVAVSPSVVEFPAYRFACVSGATYKGEVGYEYPGSIAVGALGDETLPNEICISFKRWTGHASRRDRGRVFFGPVHAATFWSSSTPDFVQTSSALQQACDLLKANLTVGASTLNPVILAADGSYSGRTILNVGIAKEWTHRKSRRTRVGA